MINKSFSNFLTNIQNTSVLETVGHDPQNHISNRMIFEIAKYLQTIPLPIIEELKEQLIKKQDFLSTDNFSIPYINNLIDKFTGKKFSDSEINNTMRTFNFEKLFQNHMLHMRYKKHQAFIEIKDDRAELSNEKILVQSFVTDSSLIFKFWYELHQFIQSHTNNITNYNFFDLNIPKNISKLGQSFRVHNFDYIPPTDNIPAYFIMSIVVNHEDLEYDENLSPIIHLAGVYLDNGKMSSYRSGLTEDDPQSAENFFNAVHMIIS